jgi:hypothetical protein
MDIEQLPREVMPGADLEDRTTARLQAAGLIRRPAHPRWWQLAAALVIFAAGAASGVAWVGAGQEPAAGQPRFLLVLLGGTTQTVDEEARAVNAYRAWARQLHDAGRYVTGERLSAQAVAVPGGEVPADAMQGYFIVSAATLADAVSVASTAPHVARGGRIVVRPIDTP